MKNESSTDKIKLLRQATQFHPSNVYRQGDVIIKETGPWAKAVHALLRHLENEGFTAAPRVIGSGFDDQGREMLSFIEGNFIDPGPWSLEVCYEIGVLLRKLHTATHSFQAPPNAIWRDWFGRSLGNPTHYGHCDFASWNIVAREKRPYALIDWEYAGPVDPMVELAQACWLNAKLHDNLVAEIEGLPPVAERAQQLRAIIDGYKLPHKLRSNFIDRIIEFVIFATANEADEAKLNKDTPLKNIDEQLPWALAWRARAATWILKHKKILQKAIY